MATLTVGAGQEYSTIAAAVAATKDGDTVLVQAGTYVNDFVTNLHKITLQSVGGLAIMEATVAAPNGKAILTTENDITVNGIGFTGATDGDSNGAGIRDDYGNLNIQNSVFWNNQDGILANPNATETISISGSEFSHNGAGDGYSHGIYVGAIAALTITNSYFHDAVVGHEIKSRAASTTITNTRIQDNTYGTASYDVDLPNGGLAVLQNDTIEKGANASNYYSIAYGEEGLAYSNNALTVTGDTLVSDNPNGRLFLNPTSVTATLSNDKLYNFGNLGSGALNASNNTTAGTEPTLNVGTMAPVVGAPPPPPTTPPAVDGSSGTTLQNWGLAGAVVASGHVLTVGASGEFRSLASALAASADGDTIEVAAGTYVNDFATINHKVIIEGVGGIAKFVQQNDVAAGPGVFIANNDVTIKNVSLSGATNYSGHEAGLYINAGNVTLENSTVTGNDIGLGSADTTTANLAVYNSDIIGNGNAAKGTHNIQLNLLNSFTLQGSYVADALVGHEIFERAYNTDIENDRIVDGPTSPASFLIDLGQGGNAVVKNNTLVKGPDAANGVLVDVGGEGISYANTNVQITGNTLVSQLQNAGHPYTYFIVGAGALSPTTVSDNTFVGGVAGSAWLQNVTDGGGNVGATSMPISTASAVSTTTTPPAFSSSFAADALTLTLAEDKGWVDAQFLVTVDGVAAGGGTVTAAHTPGSSAGQSFTFGGNWAAGPHSVAVTFLDPPSTGNGANELYVVSAALNGSAVSPNVGLQSSTPETVLLTSAPDVAGFDRAYYLAHNPDVAASGVDPLLQYETVGWTQGRDPSALFDTNFYLAQNTDVARAGVDPLLHYDTFGWKEGRSPSLLFNGQAYLAANPDVKAAGVNPLQHYEQHGMDEGRQAPLLGGSGPADILIDPTTYFSQLSATLIPTGTAGAGLAAFSYANGGWQEGLNPDKYFDTSYYLSHNPDVAASHVDPLIHYETFGWKEGRDPSAIFSTDKYLGVYTDVKAAGADPLQHYVQYGQTEGRQIFTA